MFWKNKELTSIFANKKIIPIKYMNKFYKNFATHNIDECRTADKRSQKLTTFK